MTIYEGHCLQCGVAYEGRSNRRFCSTRCRKLAYKKRARLADLEHERMELKARLDLQQRIGLKLRAVYIAARLQRVDAMIEKTSPQSSPFFQDSPALNSGDINHGVTK